ncbi:MAG: hypothetical protein ACR2RV_27980 [Verrucomicrobiales bacterium]
MKEIGHLVHLEQELEEDLEEAQRLIRRGRHDAIAELETHGRQLGKLRTTAGDVIERYAHDAEEGLRLVRSRLGELHLLLTKHELRNLEILDHFRDRVVEAMEFAEGDMEDLKQRGDEWSSKEHKISEAWNQLSRRLSLVRMHLVQEVETVSKEFGAERRDVLKKVDRRAREGSAHERGV